MLTNEKKIHHQETDSHIIFTHLLKPWNSQLLFTQRLMGIGTLINTNTYKLLEQVLSYNAPLVFYVLSYFSTTVLH